MPTSEFRKKVREFYSPYYGYTLSDEECNEINDNAIAFCRLLLKWSDKKRRAGMLKIEVKKPTQEELNELGIDTWGTWGCEVSRFDWEYQEKETCYLFEGEVTVETELETVNFGVGDLVVFPAGLKCVWDVKKPVRKVYKFD